jgi:DNA mismatch repair protein MutS
VIAAAKRYLAQLESQRDAALAAGAGPQGSLPFDVPSGESPDFSRPEARPSVETGGPDPLYARLATLDLDTLTPRQALDLLYELKDLGNPTRT